MQQIKAVISMNRFVARRLAGLLCCLFATLGGVAAERPVFELSTPLTVAAGTAFSLSLIHI